MEDQYTARWVDTINECSSADLGTSSLYDKYWQEPIRMGEIYPSSIKQTEENQMVARNVFRVIAVLHARQTKDTAGNDTTEDSKILYDKTFVAAIDASARIIASKDFAKDLTDEEISRVELKVSQL